MKEVRTVFKVKGETYAISGDSQEAASYIISQFPATRIYLVGFLIDGQFVEAEL